jgi:hypothetical protein
VSPKIELLNPSDDAYGIADAEWNEQLAIDWPLDRGGKPAFFRQYLGLVQKLFLSGAKHSPRRIVFTGIGRENQASEVCLSVGRVLAQCGDGPVCVVDATSIPSRLLPASSQVARLDGDNCLHVDDNLWLHDVIASGASRHNQLPSLDKLKDIFSRLEETFRYLLIACPGADVAGEAAVLSQFAEGVILVVDSKQTRRSDARKITHAFNSIQRPVLGAILTNRKLSIPEVIYRWL